MELKNIILTQSAYFYKTNGFDVDVRPWNKIGDAIKKAVNPARGTFQTTGWVEHSFGDGTTASYLICVYRLNDKVPPYAEEIEDFWKERQTGYVVLVAYNDYMAIQKRNAPISKCFAGLLTPLDYTALAALNSNSTYTKINMKNLDGSNNVIRSKTLVANDLKESMPYVGANRYAINTINGKKNNVLFTISLSTSHIGESPEKLNIVEFVEWSKKYVDAILNNAHPKIEDFLSVFATPLSYRKHAAQLVPTSILISRQEVLDIINDPNCTLTRLNRNNQFVDKKILARYFDVLSNRPLILTPEQNSSRYKVSQGKIWISKRADYITLRGDIFDNIELSNTKDGLYDGTLTKLINKEHLYNIYFMDNSLVYTNNTLFRDHKLLQSAELLLEVMDDKLSVGLTAASSEKGVNNSIFSTVEQEFAKGDIYLICGDLGTEWADHILISEGKVMFFAEKYKDKRIQDSASAFQDVIGQALKNLGYFTPTEADLSKKQSLWSRPYPATGAPRIRRAPANKGLQDAINTWKKNMNSPLYQKEMCIVVNFISRTKFKTDLLNALQNDNADANVKAVTFQRLWLLSSFVNTCLEAGVSPKIYCRQ